MQCVISSFADVFFETVSIRLTLSCKTEKKLAVRHKNWRVLTVDRIKVNLKKFSFNNMGKKLTDSRKMANILIISCKSHHLH